MEEFTWCLVSSPKNGSEMAGNIANLHMYRKEYTVALRWFQLSLRLDPTDANTRFNLAVMAVQELKDANGRVRHPLPALCFCNILRRCTRDLDPSP
jgi:hypothetical protein